MGILIVIIQFILGLAFLIGVHEAGHMIAAKAFGMRVEKFSIGFPPKLFKFNYKGTEYSLGAIPLGGFVKISGMMDESMDKESLEKAPEPWEFRAKPAWQRLIVMLGGIIVNVITGIIIFIMLTWSYGDNYTPIEEQAKYGIIVSDEIAEFGFQKGDVIVSANGKNINEFTSFEEFNKYFVLRGEGTCVVKRGEEEITLKIPEDVTNRINPKHGMFFIRSPFIVDSIIADKPADKAGMEKGDRVLSVAGKPIEYFDQFQEVLEKNMGKSVEIEVDRGGSKKLLTVDVEKVLVSEKDTVYTGKISVGIKFLLEEGHLDYTLGESVATGTGKAWSVISDNIIGFKKIFSGNVAMTKMSGPIGIAKLFSPEFDGLRFWSIVAMLSMILAFMNLLPIPVLDGGHVMFLLYEMITGKTPSDKFMEISLKIGMGLILALMIFVIGNDIFKLF